MATIPMDHIISASAIVPKDFDEYDVTFLEGCPYMLDLCAREHTRPSWRQHLFEVQIRPYNVGADTSWFRLRLYTTDPDALNRTLQALTDKFMPVKVDGIEGTLEIQVHVDHMHEQWLTYVVDAAGMLFKAIEEAAKKEG